MTNLVTSMRHSTREQARTYDRCMVGEKVSAVVARAANELNSVLGVQTPTNGGVDNQPQQQQQEEHDEENAECEYCPEV